MNTENRNIRFTSTVICRIFLGICCCFLAACSSQSSQNNSNIFLYAVDFSHSTLSPGNVKFDMSMEDVLQKTQLSEDDVDTTLGEAYPRIIHSISISSLSDDIQEIFSYKPGSSHQNNQWHYIPSLMSKNALSYSSASMTKKGLSVSRADTSKFCGMASM